MIKLVKNCREALNISFNKPYTCKIGESENESKSLLIPKDVKFVYCEDVGITDEPMIKDYVASKKIIVIKPAETVAPAASSNRRNRNNANTKKDEK